MNKLLTIGIITCGRPQKVRECINSILSSVTVKHEILVVDSLIDDSNRAFYDSVPNLRYVGLTDPIGPSAARRLLTENFNSSYMLFLDDDIVVPPDSVESMLAYIERYPDIDILGAAWRESGGWREVGQFFNFGNAGSDKVVFKTPVTLAELLELGIDGVDVHATQATMLVKREVFQTVNFDPQYDFFFELFDFFMQCHASGIRVHAVPSVIFEHNPTAYESDTRRQTGRTSQDKMRFEQKWGVSQIGPTGFKKPTLGRVLRNRARRLKMRIGS